VRVCIVGASGKLGRYMVQHALDRGYEVVSVCRETSVGKLAAFEGRISLVPGATNDPEVIRKAVTGCDGVLVVLVPWGVHGYSTGTAQPVLDHAEPGARLVFSCGWHTTRDGKDVYSWKLRSSRDRPARKGGRPASGITNSLRNASKASATKARAVSRTSTREVCRSTFPEPGEAAGRARIYSDRAFRQMSPLPTHWSLPAEPEGSIKGSIPAAHWNFCKEPRQKKARLRRICRAL
jgi:hypothetical protein